MQNKTDAVILTIDDEQAIREGIAAFLEYSDFTVLQAENGRVGLEIFHREKPDLVLVDLRMPELDGLKVLAEVRMTSPETPIIIVSGTGVIGDALEALRLGAWDYILKPIHDMRILEYAVRKSLERSRLLIENRKYQKYLEDEIKKRTAELERLNEELKQELNERIHAETALRESEKRFRTVLETNPDPVVLYDLMGRVVYFNPAFTRVFGWELEERLGKTMEIFVPEEVRAETKAAVEKLMSGQKVPVFETRRYTKSGNTIPISITGAVYPDQSGKPAGSVINLRDITAQIKAQEEKTKLEKQLRRAQKMEALGTLAGGVAHDFNNILQAIIGFSELARIKHLEDSAFQQDMKQVIKAGSRAKELVDQILAFSRQVETQFVPFEIRLIIKEALKLLRASLPATIEIQPHMAVEEGEDIIKADPTQIHQVLMNLCTNASHAMRDKGGELIVRLTKAHKEEVRADLQNDRSSNSYLKLTISDTGTGMAPEVLERIFDPYFTTKEKGEGTGLGLAVVHGIVKSHQGSIRVESKPDQGTHFHVYLPTVGAKETEASKAAVENVPTGHERILFVDDEQILVDLCRQMLAELGYQVVATTSSIEALEHFRAAPDSFDLVITDQTMPQMTGTSLAVELMRIRPDIPMILCTGYSEFITAEKAKALGFKAFVKKPFLEFGFAITIREVLDG